MSNIWKSAPDGVRQVNVGRDMSVDYQWDYPEVLTDTDSWPADIAVSPDTERIIIITGAFSEVKLFEKTSSDDYEYYERVGTFSNDELSLDSEVEFISNSTYLIKPYQSDAKFYNWQHSFTGVTMPGSYFTVSPHTSGAHPEYGKYIVHTTDGTDVEVERIVDSSIGSYTNVGSIAALTVDGAVVSGFSIDPLDDNTLWIAQICDEPDFTTSASIRLFFFNEPDSPSISTNSTMYSNNFRDEAEAGVSVDGYGLQFDPSGSWLIDATSAENTVIFDYPTLSVEDKLSIGGGGIIHDAFLSINNNFGSPAWFYSEDEDKYYTRVSAEPPFDTYTESFSWVSGVQSAITKSITQSDVDVLTEPVRVIYSDVDGNVGILPNEHM